MIRKPKKEVWKCPICGDPTYNMGACNGCKEKADQDAVRGKRPPWKNPDRPDRIVSLGRDVNPTKNLSVR